VTGRIFVFFCNVDFDGCLGKSTAFSVLSAAVAPMWDVYILSTENIQYRRQN